MCYVIWRKCCCVNGARSNSLMGIVENESSEIDNSIFKVMLFGYIVNREHGLDELQVNTVKAIQNEQNQ